MADEKPKAKRDAKGHWLPGQSANPGGRKKNPVTEAILAAFEAVDPVNYLIKVANTDPKTFCGLLAKVIPVQLDGDMSGKLVVSWAKDSE